MSETAETKPWVAAGVSRATWFRRKGASQIDLRATTSMARQLAAAEAPVISVISWDGDHRTIALQTALEMAKLEIAALKQLLAEQKPKPHAKLMREVTGPVDLNAKTRWRPIAAPGSLLKTK